jgi:hypothetical protein
MSRKLVILCRLVALGAIILGGFQAAAETSLKARGWTHETFGRLVIDGGEKLVRSVLLSGDQVLIEFSEPVAVDFGASLSNLSTYLDAAPNAAPTRISLTLKRRVALKTFGNDGNQVIDLRPMEDAQEPQPAPAEAESAEPDLSTVTNEAPAIQPAAAAVATSDETQPTPESKSGKPQVDVFRRLGPDGSQIVFDWPIPVEHVVSHAGGFTIIDFHSAGEIDAAQLTAAMPEAQVRLESPPAGGVRVVIRFNPGVTAKDRVEGNALILDLMQSASQSEAPVEPATGQQNSALPAQSAFKPRTYVTLMAMPEPDELLDSSGEITEGPGGEPAEIRLQARSVGGGAELRFEFSRAVRAAAFRTADTAWLVFDHPPASPLNLPDDPALSAVGEIDKIETPGALVLRIRLAKGADIQLAGEGNLWTAMMAPGGTSRPLQPIAARHEVLADGGSSLFLAALSPSAPIPVDDALGHLQVIALPSAGQGLSSPIEDAGYIVLSSQQGIIVAPNSDRLQIAALPQGVVLTVQGRTNLGAQAEAEAAPAESAAIQTLPFQQGVFDLPRWRRGGEATFAADRRVLEDAVRIASDAERPLRRLELAEFFFAHGLADETLAELNAIGIVAPAQSEDNVWRLLRVATLYFKGSFAEAETLASDKSLDGIAETKLYRGLLAGERRDWETAADELSRPLPRLSDYPTVFRMRIGLAAAEALAEGWNPLAAQLFLDHLSREALIGDMAERVEFTRGLVQIGIGKPEEAIKIWSNLLDSPVGEVRARATLAVTEDRLSKGEIDARAAAQTLDGVRFAWRGNDFELQLLRRLGDLYFQSDQPRKGFTALRNAATFFPDRPQSKEIAAEMQRQFRRLYLEGGADRLSPMLAVALYDEFRELTPTGADGDKMITMLADRLVKVDLLDQAAAILSEQVNKRLVGIDKARAGARLAAIRMLDQKPELALAALSDSGPEAPLPEDLVAERRRLEARARYDLGDTLRGIELLSGDASIDAQWLRSDMYWRLREWSMAAVSLDQLIRAELAAIEPNSPETPVVAAQSDPMDVVNQAAGDPDAAVPADPGEQLFKERIAPLLLNRAVALSLAGERKELKALGKEFGERMAATDQAQGFAMLTAPDNGLVESVSAEMQSVDQIQTFVDEYRRHLETASLGGS